MLEFYIHSLAGIRSFSSWPHCDITSLCHSVTCTFLSSPFFLQQRCFEIGFIFTYIKFVHKMLMLMHVGCIH